MQQHWHFHRNEDEEDPFVSIDLYAILASVTDELREQADQHYQDISGLGDSGLHEEAYRAFQRWEIISNLADNVTNVVNVHNTRDRLGRPPLYRTGMIDQQQGDWSDTSKLYQTALWVVKQVSAESPLEIYPCTSDDIIGDEDGTWHESYSISGQ